MLRYQLFCWGVIGVENNTDMQLVFNHYKAVTYTRAYFSKAEDEILVAVRAANKVWIGNKSDYEKIKSVTRIHASKTKCRAQKEIYNKLEESDVMEIVD